MKKGQTIKNVKISTIWFWWVGIGIAENGKKILIKGSVLPHSIVDCVIIKAKRDHILAMPIRVISIEDGRADETPRCPHYSNPLIAVPDNQVHKNGCGWCKRQLLSYAKQLDLKVHLVHDSFRATEYLIDKVWLEPIIPSPLTYQYRNKIEFSFGKYITKAKNDKKAQQQKDTSSWTRPEGSPLGGRNEAIHTQWSSQDSGSSPEWQQIITQEDINATPESEFSHRFDRQLGFHKQWFYTHVVDVDQCYLISEKLHAVYHHLKQRCQNTWLPVYDSKQNKWFFRHLVLRQGVNTDQILVNLVVATDALNTQDKELFWEECKKQLIADTFLQEQCNTFLITINNTVSDAVRRQDAPVETLRGQGYIFEELRFSRKSGEDREEIQNSFVIEDGQLKEIEKWQSTEKNQLTNSPIRQNTNISFRVSPFSFFQTNTLGAQELFTKAASFIKLTNNKQTIMDLYCGAGTIGLSLLAQWIGNFVIGIEIVEDAIKDANYNAQINKLDTQSYFAAGKTEVLLKHDTNIASRLEDVGLVIVDPPREWLHKDVVTFLNQLKKEHKFQLIYISCNPVTLARDLDLLVQEWWWDLQVLQPVDMFPHTHHVEMISVLQ